MSTDGVITAADGVERHWQTWPAPSPTRAAVVVSHGACEHGGRYAALAEDLAAIGVGTLALDHRGHGRSGGRRGDLGTMGDAAAAVRALAGERRPAGMPWFLLGYSMGAVIALECALAAADDPPRGLVLVGAAVDPTAVKRWQALAARWAAAALPGVGVVAIDAAALVRDPDAVAAYRRDPLVHHGRVTLRTAAQVIGSAGTLPERIGALSMPLLTMHGGDDRLAAPAGSSTIHRHIGAADRTEHVYPGVLHDVLRDLPRERLRADLVSWIDQRV